ncbi:MAG: hypothetical protein KAT49_01365 [Methanomicrobia archaeon]|nr:hypothetical protein [Methanomicrobia archaeon]
MMKLTKRLCAAMLILSIFLVNGCVQSENATPASETSRDDEEDNSTDQATSETIAEQFEGSQFGIAISHFGSDYLTRMPEDLLGAGSHWAGSHIMRWYEIEPVKGEFN